MICKTIESNLLEILERALSRKASLEVQQTAHRKACQDLFAAYDTDSSGAISADNLEVALNRAGLAVTKKEAAALLRRYDPDSSGLIERAEFEEMFLDRVALSSGQVMA